MISYVSFIIHWALLEKVLIWFIWLRPIYDLFGVLIHGYDLTWTLPVLVSQCSFYLLNLQRATHSHWWFIFSIYCDRLKNACFSVLEFSMFRLADSCCQRHSQRVVSCIWCWWFLMLLESYSMSLSENEHSYWFWLLLRHSKCGIDIL